MNRELFFIPILANALNEPDVQQALQNAFAAIDRLGHDESYKEGYRNFETFMAEFHAHWQILHEQDIRMGSLMSAAATSPETQEWAAILQDQIDQNPAFRADHEAVCEVLTPCPRVPLLQLLRDGRQIGQVGFETVPGRHMIDDLRPGCYALRLDTGLVLWEGELAAHDLIWAQALDGRSLELAAETGESRRQPTREVAVSGAGVVLRTFPGLESGSVEIELKR